MVLKRERERERKRERKKEKKRERKKKRELLLELYAAGLLCCYQTLLSAKGHASK